MITENVTTYALISREDFSALYTVSANAKENFEIDFPFRCEKFAHSFKGNISLKIIPTAKAENICINKKPNAELRRIKKPFPQVPIIKADPELLQNAKRRSASFFVHKFDLHSDMTEEAPMDIRR